MMREKQAEEQKARIEEEFNRQREQLVRERN
jgi:hypothetical protein